MSRRAAAVTLVTTSALLGALPSQGDTPPPPLMPLATCETRVNDIPGDGIPKLGADNVNGVPTVDDPRGNVAALDATSITFRLTETRVLAFMALSDVPDGFRETDSAYGYTMWFTFGSKIARFEKVHANPAHAQQGLAPTTGLTTASVGTSPSGGNSLTGIGGGVDAAKNVVYVYADRASLEAQLGVALVDGDTLTAINGRTELWETKGDVAPGVVRRPADKTDVPAASATWAVGDDRCFPASRLTVANAAAQQGDAVTLTATLKDEAGAALAGRKVTVTVTGESARTLTTDAAGAVRVALPAAPPAGTYAVRAAYLGDEQSGAAQGSGTLAVRAETIRVSVPKVTRAGTARTVTATFTEDDPRAFARQPVAWYVGGRKVATLVTDSAGRSVFKGAKPGQKVQVRYLGASGLYAPVASKTVVA